MVTGQEHRPSTSGPTPVEVPAERHGTSWLWEQAGSADRRHIVRFPADDQGREWSGLTIAELAQRVRAVAGGLIASGLEPGDRVALMSPTRLEWTVADLAILSAGGVTVPVYDTSSVDQCRWILEDAEAALALAGDGEHARRLREAAGDRVREVFVFDDGALDELARRGGDHTETVTRRLERIRGDDLATIVYTSGTTGPPKGCLVTHGNVAWTVAQSRAGLVDLLEGKQSTLLFLPLAHIFARVVQFIALEAKVEVGYARSLETMKEDLLAVRPTFILAVPRVFQKVFNSAQRQATGVKRPIFRFAVSTAEAWGEATRPGPLLRARRRLADALVYRKLRAGIGGRVRYCLSGGAPLPPHLARFFHAAGITILEGYGLTETTAPATAATPDRLRFGSVGPPLPGVSVRLADDGEILIRGGNVFAGYHNNPEATAEALDDGWLHTGDIGEIDADGFVRVTDRKKEIIVTAGGKNVAPSTLEEQLKSNPLISQAVLVGDDRPFIGALVTLDAETVEARRGGMPDDPNTDHGLRSEVRQAIEEANRAVSRAESIRNFVILGRELSEDEGELTPTQKVKRAQVAKHFGDEIESLYARS